MATFAVQRPSPLGASLSLAAASAGGDQFANSGVEYFQILNSHATAPRTVTFDSPQACDFGLSANAAHDRAIVVPGVSGAPANRVVVGPFPVERFNDANGNIQVTYSDSGADLTLAVMGR